MELSPKGILPPLHIEVLERFFRHSQGFFLTGGTALAGFYLGHRSSNDLDLFCTDDKVFSGGQVSLEAVAREMGGKLDAIQTAPTFCRFALEQGGGNVLVDLVRDTAYQAVKDKPSWKGVRVDAIEDITANKLCTVLSRFELRD